MQTQNHIDGTIREIGEFTLTVIWLGVAYGIAMAGGYRALSDMASLKVIILQSLIIVFFAFVFHELAHRFVARRYGFHAVYRTWMPGLILALVVSMTGWIFAAPGAVYITGTDTAATREKLGKSALAGPVMNMILAALFTGLTFLAVPVLRWYIESTTASFAQVEPVLNFIFGVLLAGVQINAWLALFNLIPFGQFDGLKVFSWNKKVWGIALAASVALYGAWWWVQGRLF
ncbi:MAG: site-2 protease family protein [Dehalococcoidia bacterium]|nr:site-2 protease family protein [Dehalococcoidia bacterium]